MSTAALPLTDVQAEAPNLPGIPFLGHIRAMRGDSLELFDRARDFAPATSIPLGPTKILALSAPEHVHHLLVSHADHYGKSTRGYQVLRLLLGDGLVTSEGAHWKKQRRIANPAFRRKSVEGFVDCMRDATTSWAEQVEAGTLDISRALHRLALKIAGETLLGVDLSAEGNRVGEALDVILPSFPRLTMSLVPFAERWPTAANRAFHGAVHELDTLVFELIAERRASTEEHYDLLQMFMHTPDPETGECMSDTQLRDEVLTMLLAGHETTANAMTWALYLLAKNPDIAKAAAAEVHEVLADRAIGVSDVPKLDLVGRIFSETLRLYPPVWLQGRQCVEDDRIDGFHVPAGRYVYISTFAIHRDPAVWTEPLRFDPDRFLPEAKAAIPRGAYHPFAMGKRKCIGDRFARTEAVVMLATMLQRLEFHDLGEHVVLEPTLTLRPLGGLRLHVTCR